MSEIKRFDNYINEGVSNWKGELMQTAIEEFEKRKDRLEKKNWKGTFKFKIMVPKLWGEGEEELTIDVKFEDRGWNSSGGYMKFKEYDKKAIIFINANPNSNPKRLFNTYIHEITHVSQKLNGFLDHAWNKHRDKYDDEIVSKKRKSKVPYTKWYRNSTHDEHEAEWEANFVPLLEILKRGEIDDAVEYLISKPSYMRFTWKQFIQKAYAWGVSKETILTIRERFLLWFNDKFMEIYNRISDENITTHFTIDLYQQLDKYTPVLLMFNDVTKYFKMYDDIVERRYAIQKEKLKDNPKRMDFADKTYIFHKNFTNSILN
jgi:hypothetical protein